VEIGCDFETMLIAPGLAAPPPVCVSVALSPTEGEVVPTPEARAEFLRLLRDPEIVLVGHNFIFDLLCSVAWWDCSAEVLAFLEADRLVDTMVYERVAEIQGSPRKKLALDSLWEYYGLGALPKGLVRLSYGPLLNRPLSEYSTEQIQYSVDDSTAVLQLLAAQRKRHPDVRQADVADLCRKLFWLNRTAAFGMRTSPDRIDGLRAAAEEHLGELRGAAEALGVVRPNGTKNIKVLRDLVTEAYDGRPPMTQPPRAKKGAKPRKKPWVPNVRTSSSVLTESGDPRLQAIAEYGEWSAVQNMVLPAFESGTYQPIHTRFSLADTTRVNSSGPNLLNIRSAEGIRECFIPRGGYVFVDIDHTGLENVALAQVLVSKLRDHRLADFLNGGGDLHCKTGAEIHHCTYEQALALHADEEPAFEKSRKNAKWVNFGRPGGAGWRTLQYIARQMGKVSWTEHETKSYIKAWERAVPAGPMYHDWVKNHPQNAQGWFQVQIPGTTIQRRWVPFCAAANNGFQGLGTVVESKVGWSMLREHLTPGTVLSGCYPVLFVHDEFIFEVPEELVTQAAERLVWHMTQAPEVRALLPDVEIKADPKAMRFWSKKARRIIRNGELIPWPEAS